MERARGRRLRFIYGIFLSLLTILVGVLFIAEAWSIYRSAPQSPYTAEKIRASFEKISISVWVFLAAFVGSLVLSAAYPEEKKRPKAYVDMQTSLERMKRRFPEDGAYTPQAAKIMQKQEKKRKVVYVLCAIVLGVASLLSLAILGGYLYQPLMEAEFFAAHDGVADKLVQICLLFVVGFSVACLCAWYLQVNRRKEQKGYIQLLADEKAGIQPPEEKVKAPKPPKPIKEKKRKKTKGTEAPKSSSRWEKVMQLLVNELFFEKHATQAELDEAVTRAMAMEPAPKVKVEKEPKVKTEKAPKEKKAPVLTYKEKKASKSGKAGKTLVRLGLCAVAVVLLVIGVQNGGMEDVFLKAINICTQCIGLG